MSTSAPAFAATPSWPEFAPQDPNIALSLHHSMVEGFMEDKAIIEGQQKTLEADPEFRMNAIAADAALAHFRRALAKMIAEERKGLEAVAA